MAGSPGAGLRLIAVHLRYKQVVRPRKQRVFGDVFARGLKKPFFQPMSPKRLLWIDCRALFGEGVSFQYGV